MKKLKAKISFTTPCISSGADQKKAEIRAQSIRGALHFWFRALGGSLPEEQAIFGRIGKKSETRRSSLNVRVLASDNLETSVKDCAGIAGSDFDYFLWPLRSKKHSPGAASRGIIKAGESFDLLLSHIRIDEAYKTLPEEVLKTWLLLGSLGSRSRRCYGSIWPEKMTIDKEDWDVPKTKLELELELLDLLENKPISVRIWGSASTWKDAVKLAQKPLKNMRCGSPKSGTPSSWGKNDHDIPLNNKSGESVFRQALGLPLLQRYSNKRGTYSSSINGNDRWASPLHLKIVPLENKYYVLAIYFHDYVLSDGENVLIKGNGIRKNAVLSLDLWEEILQEGDRFSGT